MATATTKLPAALPAAPPAAPAPEENASTADHYALMLWLGAFALLGCVMLCDLLFTWMR